MSYILSIIIPIYNVEKYIDRCLQSILPQTLTNNIEIIVVNDGTPDKSMNIVSKYAETYSISIINQQNQGLSMARNNGLKVAHGEYIWFVDSDDTLLPGSIDKIIKVLNSHVGIDVIATVLLQQKESDGTSALEYTPDFSVNTGREYMFRGNHLGASQRYIIRKKFLLDNNLFFMPNVYHEDGEFGHKMMYLAKTVYVMPDPVYCYLLRSSGSIMSTRNMKMNYDLIVIYKELEKFCKTKVEEKDRIRFLSLAANCVYDTILFSRRVIFTKEFKHFYVENKKLIHQVAGQFLPHLRKIGWRSYIRAMHFYFYPLGWTKTKTIVKQILKNIRNIF